MTAYADAPDHPHLRARGTFVEHDGVVQPAPAPRFSRTEATLRDDVSVEAAEVLAAWGLADSSTGSLARMETHLGSTRSSSGPDCRASAPRRASGRSIPTTTTSCSRAARPAAAPGTSSATRASGPTPTCTPWATASSRGRGRRRSPTAPRSSTTCARPPGSTTSSGASATPTASSPPTGTPRPPVDRHGRDPDGVRASRVALPLVDDGLLRLRRAVRRRHPRPRRLRRPGRSPAALARRPRRRREARGGDRLRRDGRHARAGPGRPGRGPRHDAAALADVRAAAAGGRPGGVAPAALAARDGGLPRRPVQEHRGRGGVVPDRPTPPRARPPLRPQGQRRLAARGLPGRPRLQAGLRRLGPAAVPGARRRPVPGDPQRHRRGRHRHDHGLHRRRGRARVGPARSMPTSS